TGDAVLAASRRFMGLLAVFFVFDFAINFLSALLRAAKEQAYLLRVTVAAAAGFGLLVVSLPPPADGTWLLGAFIAAQAAWAVLPLLGVVRRWPGKVVPPGPAAPSPWDTGKELGALAGAGGAPVRLRAAAPSPLLKA